MEGSKNAPRTVFSISAVERDTGLSKDTLRVWERRYRFPLPERDHNGERVFTQEQVDKLRALKRLIDRGHRPSRIIGHSLGELLALVAPPGVMTEAVDANLDVILDLLRAHRIAELRQALSQTLMRQGLCRFCLETIAPLNQQIGEQWMRGQLEIYEEHLYTETLQSLLRSALASIPQHGQPPRVLLTTFPNEQHSLGLLMAEAMLALEGASCVSLGAQTPIRDIISAAATHQVDVIALSFSLACPANQVVDGLGELRDKIAEEVEIWAGGSNPTLIRRGVKGVQALPTLEAIPAAVARWRARHAEGRPGAESIRPPERST